MMGRNDSISITNATYWFTLATFINSGLSYIITPIMVRYMSASEIGGYSVFYSWQSIITIIVTLNLFYGFYEANFQKYRSDYQQFTNSVASLCILIQIIAAIIGYLFINTLSRLSGISKDLLLLMTVQIFTNSIFQFWYIKNRYLYNIRFCVLTSISLSLIQSILSILFVIFIPYDKVVLRVIANIIPTSIIIAFILIKQIVFGEKRELTKYWKPSFLFNLVLLPHYLSRIVLHSSDRIMISLLVSSRAVGIYSIAYTCASIVRILLTSMESAIGPIIYKGLESREYRPIQRNVNITFIGSLVCIVVFLLILPEFMYIFTSNEYLEALDIIPVIIFALYLTFFYSFFSYVEFFNNKGRFVSIASTASAILNIALNLIFIRMYGYKAAAYTTLICYVLYAIGHYIVYKKIVNNVKVFDIKVMILCTVILGIACATINVIYDMIFFRFGILLVLIYIIFMNKNKFIRILKTLKS